MGAWDERYYRTRLADGNLDLIDGAIIERAGNSLCVPVGGTRQHGDVVVPTARAARDILSILNGLPGFPNVCRRDFGDLFCVCWGASAQCPMIDDVSGMSVTWDGGKPDGLDPEREQWIVAGVSYGYSPAALAMEGYDPAAAAADGMPSWLLDRGAATWAAEGLGAA